ncbi:tRNA lysidine(34) synthetase TilS [Ligilactobacillus ceti]|nr:tRNA lysidine(34) synthetase TilS [Ligilactobacillus ceti]
MTSQKLSRMFASKMQKWPLAQQKILVAVSTGVDSMVLLHLLQNLPEEQRPLINVAYVNHELRAASQQETQYLQAYCQMYQIPLFIKNWPRHTHPITGIEAAARTFRYTFFAEIMQQEKINYLMTAHHGNDQVENFLMKLIRGGAIQQLCGIELERDFQEQGCLIRPLLDFQKETLRQYAQQHHIRYFDDETNFTDDYFRNRIRNQLIPQMTKENDQVVEHILNYQNQLNDLLLIAQESGEQLVQNLKQNDDSYQLREFQNLSSAQQKLVLRIIFERADLYLKTTQMKQCLQLLNNLQKPQGSIDLTQNIQLQKTYTKFKIMKKQTQSRLKMSQSLILGEWQTLDEQNQVGLFETDKITLLENDDVYYLEKSPVDWQIRHRQAGDRLMMKSGSQKIKKILIDQKIPQMERENIWLLTNQQQQVYWVLGIKKSDLSQPLVNAKMHYIIIYRKIG